MRVAMVSEHASPLATLGGVDAGGQNVHVAALATAMARRGAQVVVHSRRDDADLPRNVSLAPAVVVNHVDAGPPAAIPKDELLPYMEEFADVLAHEWRRRPPDIVHAHFWMSAIAALSAARRVGIPVVHTFHALGVVKRRYQGEFDTSPPERVDRERDIARDVDHIVATCTDEVFELVRMGVGNGRLTVIPCGVDLRMFGPEGPVDRRRTGLKRIVCVGRLVPRKGVGNVISALEHVPNTELVIAGGAPARDLDGDPEARRLKALAEEHGVIDRVDFRGRVERGDLPALLRSADAVVCAPWYEPFGIVPLEAMACGVPVVASAVGGLIDTVVDGVTGVHVPPRDPDRLASAIRDLVHDRERGRTYGRAGVDRARRLYDWDRIAGTTLDLYTKVLRGSVPRRSSRATRASRRFGLAPSPREHLAELSRALGRLNGESERIERCGSRLADAVREGGRVLTLGDGGAIVAAEHLAAELVNRPVSALCLNLARHGSQAPAGESDVLARDVRAHGRYGDVLVAFESPGGRSRTVLAALSAANQSGLTTIALTGDGGSAIAGLADEALTVPAPSPAVMQELQIVAVDLLSAATERELALTRPAAAARTTELVRR